MQDIEVTLTHPPLEQIDADWDRITRDVDDALRDIKRLEES